MKIAIHKTEGSFSDYWLAYLEQNSIPFKVVDCYSNDIIQQLSDVDILLWHHQHKDYRDLIFAKSLLHSLQQSGKKVFPDFNTGWHFDDKVAQKYLLESIGAPLIPTYVFYSEQEAIKWASTTSFPKVFKLRGGAGASNVKLIRTYSEAKTLIRKSFDKGFSQYNKWDGLLDRINKFKSGTGNFKSVLGGVMKLFTSSKFDKMTQKEKGYFYVQEFVPQNNFDIRVVVIGNKAFALKRMVRDNDFRASGSGKILFEKENFNEETIQIAFDVSKRLNLQCCAFDFIYSPDKKPLIVEVSYGFSPAVYFNCEGYWDDTLKFYQEKIKPFQWIIENIIQN